MSDHPLPPKDYTIENDWWMGQLVSVGGGDAVVGSFTLDGTQKVRHAYILYLSAADHRSVVEACVQRWFCDIPGRVAFPCGRKVYCYRLECKFGFPSYCETAPESTPVDGSGLQRATFKVFIGESGRGMPGYFCVRASSDRIAAGISLLLSPTFSVRVAIENGSQSSFGWQLQTGKNGSHVGFDANLSTVTDEMCTGQNCECRTARSGMEVFVVIVQMSTRHLQFVETLYHACYM